MRATWLVDVLRAEGLNVVGTAGWQTRGHGNFGSYWGVMTHHTGHNATGWQTAQNGVPGLPGPIYNIHIDRAGLCTVVAAGVCWHAGRGEFPGLPTNNANFHTLSIGPANDGSSGWPPAQRDAMLRASAAIVRHLNLLAQRVIGHKDYAGRAQGKWDPGLIDTHGFQREITDHLSNTEDDFMSALSEAEQRELLYKTRRIYRELTQLHPSRSEYRDSDTPIDTMPGMAINADARAHETLTEVRNLSEQLNRHFDLPAPSYAEELDPSTATLPDGEAATLPEPEGPTSDTALASSGIYDPRVND